MNAGGITSDAIVSQQTSIGLGPSYTPPNPPIVPILQRQDGTYVGTFPSNVTIAGFSCVQTNMVAFNLAGSQLWIVPNYTPQIATSDDGLIAKPVPLEPPPFCSGGGSSIATTFDQNGNAEGQMANVSSYSWKGAYLLGGGLSSSVVPYPNISPALGAVAGGNITGNGATIGHQSFGLAWCGTNVPGGLSECTTNGPTPPQPPQDMAFLYQNLCNPKAKIGNFGSAYPQWVTAVENGALQSFQDAFKKYPISVVLASKHRQTTRAACQSDPKCLSTNVADQNHVVRVAGNPNPPSVGYTYSNTLTPLPGVVVTQSDVYYYQVMKNAETAWWNYNSSAANWCPNYPPQNTSDVQKLQTITNTIGVAIGNAAAHEIGHQLDGFPYMDCGPTGAQGSIQGCEKNNNFVYNFYTANPLYDDPKNPNDPANGGEFFYDLPNQPLIHWETTNDCYLNYWSTHTSILQIIFSSPNSCTQ
jgi:hypothetical protein